MRFQDRFELPTAIRARDNEIAMTGTEISSGRPVTVHLLLERQSAETTGLLEAIAGLSADRRQHILDAGEFEGIPYFITYPLPANISLRAWASTPEPQRVGEVLRPAGYKTPEPGEFTRLFQARSFEPLRPTSAPAGASAVPASPFSSEPTPKPGEFTALLHSSSAPKQNFNVPGTGPAPTLPEKPSVAPNESGEFTRMMRSPLAPEGDAAEAKPTVKPPPGEFTQLVQGDAGFDKIGTPARPPSRQPVQPPSEFTRMLQKDGSRTDDLFSSNKPMAPLSSSDGFATGAFSNHVLPASPAPTGGPGEFTRIVSAPAAPTPTPAPVNPAAPQAEPARPKGRPSYTPLVVVLVAIAVVALIVIVVFVVQH